MESPAAKFKSDPMCCASGVSVTSDMDELSDDVIIQRGDKNWWVMILVFLCLIVVFGNGLVIISVCRERLLQNITNYFIVSLAVADLLVAGFVMPFSVYVLVRQAFFWGANPANSTQLKCLKN